jgi:hypothetical protein
MSQVLVLALCFCSGLMAGCRFNYLVLIPATFATFTFSYLAPDSGGAPLVWLLAGVNIVALQAGYLISALMLQCWARKRAKTAACCGQVC